MPTYGYKCECGEEMEDFALMSQMKETVTCTKCGKDAPRHYGGSMVGLKDNPRWSTAMGVHPSQIKAAMKKWPGSVYNSKGYLRVQNRSEKLVRMKQRGYTEYA
ncbi:MAG: FmdB family zinc ribbon protein [Candidatus Thorarchaeota archaeon]|jgi:putative FmdB family regulatory protein